MSGQERILKTHITTFNKSEDQMNNRAIRTAMFKAGINQRQLASILGTSGANVSIMLSRELSRDEQRKVVSLIKQYEAHDDAEQNPEEQ